MSTSTNPSFLAGVPRVELRNFCAQHTQNLHALELFTAHPTNGSVIDKWGVASNDAGGNILTCLIGKPLTLQTNMGTANFVDGGGGSDTITRSAGNFVTDGWRVGDNFIVNDATTFSNVFWAQLTSVSSGTLTFATAKVGSAEAFKAGSKIYRVQALTVRGIATYAGYSQNVPCVNMLDPVYLPVLRPPENTLELGADEALFGLLATTCGAGENIFSRIAGFDL